jgi:STE24 endopeptidase
MLHNGIILTELDLTMTFTLTFISLVIASTLIRLWLAGRHIRHVQQHRDHVPAAFSATITLDAHQKAADYTAAKSKLSLSEGLVQTLLLLALTLGGGLQSIDNFWQPLFADQAIIRGVAVICSAMVLTSLIDLPFDYYKTFVIDGRFGFNKMTVSMFTKDFVKHSFEGLILGVPVLLLALWLMESADKNWWLYLWAALSVYILFISAIYPIFIAPHYNKFTPLEDLVIRKRIESLLTKCGFKSQGLFVMDGSTRSSHGNAYFTGFGKSKRAVFYDTLLARLNADEIEAVLAHELGHLRCHHLIKQQIFGFIVTFLGLALLGWLMQQPWFYTGLGVQNASNYMALMLFLLVSPVFLFLMRPLMASYSRKNEFEADAYAAKQASAKDLVSALVKLYRDNAATLTPDPLHSAFYDSHPPASLRIAKLTAYSS